MQSPYNFFKKVLNCFREDFYEAKITMEGDLRVNLGEKQDVFLRRKKEIFKTFFP